MNTFTEIITESGLFIDLIIGLGVAGIVNLIIEEERNRK